MKLTILGILMMTVSCGKYAPELKTESEADANTTSKVVVSTDKQELDIKSITSLDTILAACGVVDGDGKVIRYDKWTFQSECLEQFKLDLSDLGV